MAEREGFEPSLEFPLNTLSKRAPSATRPSLRKQLFQSNAGETGSHEFADTIRDREMVTRRKRRRASGVLLWEPWRRGHGPVARFGTESGMCRLYNCSIAGLGHRETLSSP